MIVKAGLTLKLSSITAVCGVNKRHEQEREDKDRRQGVKQGRAVNPYCALSCGVLRQGHRHWFCWFAVEAMLFLERV